MGHSLNPITVADIYLRDILEELVGLREDVGMILALLADSQGEQATNPEADAVDEGALRERLQGIHGIGPSKADEIMEAMKS